MVNLPKKKIKRNKKDIIHAIISASIVIVVLAISLYYSMPDVNNSQPSEEAVRLKLVAPSSVPPNKEILINIYAVNEIGKVDTTRKDIIELSLTDDEVAKLNTTRVTLKDGKATITIIGATNRMGRNSVTVIGTWVSGETRLMSSQTSIIFRSIA